MEKPVEATAPKAAAGPSNGKRFFNWGWIAWPVVVVELYFLSLGPVLKFSGTPLPSYYGGIFYAPAWLAYDFPPVHKPMGLYLHLWRPDKFDKNGDSVYKPNKLGHMLM